MKRLKQEMKTIKDADFLQFVGRQESQFFASPGEFRDRVLDRFAGRGGTVGDLMPWKKTHGKVAFRPGEVSLWPGVNGHGKSLLCGQALCWWMGTSKSLLCSLEMQPAASLQRMIRQCSGTPAPTEGYIRKWMDWTDDRLWIYDQLDTVESERILGMVHYAAVELGIQHIVIDSLVKCGIPGGERQYAAQKEFMDRLCWAAKTHGPHIHLVHHMRKGESEAKVPDKFDVKGAGELVDLVDNLFIVHRNKAKERKVEQGKPVEEFEPDGIIDVAKQRHGEWEGRINLYFHKTSQQYLGAPNGMPMHWPGFDYQGEEAA